MHSEVRIYTKIQLVMFISSLVFGSFFKLCVSITATHPSVDIYTDSFFNILPPVDCLVYDEQKGTSNKVDLREIEDVLGPGSHLKRMADEYMTTFQEQHEDSISGSTTSNLRRKNVDCNVPELVHNASKILFGGSPASVQGNPACLPPVTELPPIILCIIALLNLEYSQNMGFILCECSRLFLDVEGRCQAVSEMSTRLACKHSSRCPPSVPKPFVPSENPRVANLPMVEKLPTPNRIPNEFVMQEIATYYLLLKSLALLSYDADQASCDPIYSYTSSISGWNVLTTANLMERKIEKPGDRVPFARLSTRQNNEFPALADFLITIRGTITSSEWGVVFNYNHMVIRVGEVDSVPVHHGYANLAFRVWGFFRLELEKAFDNGTLGLITITGHGLGGGVASVLAALVSNQFPHFLPKLEVPRLRLILFGAGRSGGSELTSALSKVSIVRAIQAEFDPFPLFPCDGMSGCEAKNVPVPTARNKLSLFNYSPDVGIVNVTRLDLPPEFSHHATNLEFEVWHTCAYHCWASVLADPANPSLCFAEKPTEWKPVPSAMCDSFFKHV